MNFHVGVVGTAAARDAGREALPAIEPGICDYCGGKISTLADRNPEETKFCCPDCRRDYYKLAATAGRYLLPRLIRARLFKHAKPGERLARESEINLFIQDLIDRIDRQRREIGNRTLAELRRAAREEGDE